MIERLKLYFSTILYPVIKILYYFLAVFVAALIIFVGVVISFFIESDFVLTITTLVTIFAFINVYQWESEQYKAGQIAVYTQTFISGNIPKHPIKFGLEWVNKRFTTNEIFDFVKKVFVAIKNKIKKGKFEFGLFYELRTLIIFLLISLVPYLGNCVYAYTYLHSDEEVLECVINALEAFFRNIKQLIWPIIKSFLITAIEALVSMILFASLLQPLLVGTSINEQTISLYGSANTSIMLDASLYIAVLFVLLIFIVFLKPFGVMRVTQKFVNVIGVETEYDLAFNKYQTIMAKVIDKIKTKHRNKKV